MLVVDPMKRITIPEIRQHPWFQHKLPAYLRLPPELMEKQERVSAYLRACLPPCVCCMCLCVWVHCVDEPCC
jgi:hypothetical protein